MAIGVIGKKIGMTQVFAEDGTVIPVTVIEIGPCAIVQKKTIEKDGYSALKIGYSAKKIEKLRKPLRGQFKKMNGNAYSALKEFRVDKVEDYQVGDNLTLDLFDSGEKVVVTGFSKGKGFAGVIKRWGFSRGPMTHGSKFHRAQGSTGTSATPSRVIKGRKMPGHLGAKKVTVKGLEIIDIRQQENTLLLKGAIPGCKNGMVAVYKCQTDFKAQSSQ